MKNNFLLFLERFVALRWAHVSTPSAAYDDRQVAYMDAGAKQVDPEKTFVDNAFASAASDLGTHPNGAASASKKQDAYAYGWITLATIIAIAIGIYAKNMLSNKLSISDINNVLLKKATWSEVDVKVLTKDKAAIEQVQPHLYTLHSFFKGNHANEDNIIFETVFNKSPKAKATVYNKQGVIIEEGISAESYLAKRHNAVVINCKVTSEMQTDGKQYYLQEMTLLELD